MQEQEYQVEITKKNDTSKKVLKGCGCGCLVIILIVAVLGYFGFRTLMTPIWEMEALGYQRIVGQKITVTEGNVIEGSVVYVGQVITIDGTINGDVAVMCQQLTVNGTINGKLDLLFCQNVTVTETGVITGDVHSNLTQSMSVIGDIQGKITGKFQHWSSSEQND